MTRYIQYDAYNAIPKLSKMYYLSWIKVASLSFGVFRNTFCSTEEFVLSDPNIASKCIHENLKELIKWLNKWRIKINEAKSARHLCCLLSDRQVTASQCVYNKKKKEFDSITLCSHKMQSKCYLQARSYVCLLVTGVASHAIYLHEVQFIEQWGQHDVADISLADLSESVS